jgi:hypothetical protein
MEYEETYQEKICINLEEAGLILDSAQCSFTGNHYDVVSEIFLVGEVNYDFVMTGMNGFRILKQYSVKTSVPIEGCDSDEVEIIEFELIPGFLRFSDTFAFQFCNNILIDLYWFN